MRCLEISIGKGDHTPEQLGHSEWQTMDNGGQRSGQHATRAPRLWQGTPEKKEEEGGNVTSLCLPFLPSSPSVLLARSSLPASAYFFIICGPFLALFPSLSQGRTS